MFEFVENLDIFELVPSFAYKIIQYRVEVLFKYIVGTARVSVKASYYSTRTEFQNA